MVGYSIRFDEKVDRNLTRIKFMTDGMLIREMILDPNLTRYFIFENIFFNTGKIGIQYW